MSAFSSQSKVLPLGLLAQRSRFGSALESAQLSGSCESAGKVIRFLGSDPVLTGPHLCSKPADEGALRLLKDCGPAALAVEISCLSSEGGGASSLLLAFICMIDSMLAKGRDFDLAHAYLALFLKVSQSQTDCERTALPV